MKEEKMIIKGDCSCLTDPFVSRGMTVPSSRNFRIRPKTFPQLEPNFTECSWNFKEKTIKLFVVENKGFDVLRWMEYIQETQQQFDKSPFSFVDGNCISVFFLDCDGTDIAEIRFSHLGLTDHNCVLFNNATSLWGIDAPTEHALSHELTLSYQHFAYQVLSAGAAPCDGGDLEWQGGHTN